MKAGIWIAGRYSFARKRFRVINIISAVSLGGIIVGVTTLLVVMSVLNGFQQLARDLFLTIESPIQLVPVKGSSLALPDSLMRSLVSIDGVASAEPFAEGKAIIATRDRSELVMLKGLTPEAHDRLMRQTGRTSPLFGEKTISAGSQLALRLRLNPLQEVRLFSPELISLGLEALSDPYLLPGLTLTGARTETLFSLQKIFDDRYVLVPADMARSVLLLGEERSSGIDIRILKGSSTGGVERRIQAWRAKNGLAESVKARRLEEKYSDMFAVMQLEKWASFVILMLVIVVAVLSLTGSLAMTVIDKQRELFYLRCLGLERPQFMTIFIVEGGLTGVAGTTAGSLLAWLICTAQDAWGIVRLSSSGAFIIDAYPVSMKAGDFAAVGMATIMLCLLVSLYPARRAAAIATSKSLESKTN